MSESFDVIVIGAGHAGLSVGWHLARTGLSFVLLDKGQRVGDSWRNRWDSLRLFTPARYDGLVGMPFPAPPDAFPTHDEMADYLEAYARHFALPVRNSVTVERVYRRDGRFVVRAGGRDLLADQVVVAAASHQEPRVPAFAADLDPAIVQLHSSEYRNPSDLRDGSVLVVGAGNSGAELARELARTHRVVLSGRDVGHVPFQIDSFLGHKVLGPLVLRVVFHQVLSVANPIGRRARPALVSKGGPLIRIKPAQLDAAGVERAPRTAGTERGRPRLDDGRVLDVANVVWCTGFRPCVSWIDLPILDEHGAPRQHDGIALDQPGLYFAGLHFQHAFSSSMIHGAARDAAHVVSVLVDHAPA